jgi:hypothetical protein
MAILETATHGILSLAELAVRVRSGDIDTVIAAHGEPQPEAPRWILKRDIGATGQVLAQLPVGW